MKVAVVGATGLVGTKMLQVLSERAFPVTELIPVASERSIGKEVMFNGKGYKVVSMADAIAAKPDVALFSAGGTTSLTWRCGARFFVTDFLQLAYNQGIVYIQCACSSFSNYYFT